MINIIWLDFESVYFDEIREPQSRMFPIQTIKIQKLVQKFFIFWILTFCTRYLREKCHFWTSAISKIFKNPIEYSQFRVLAFFYLKSALLIIRLWIFMHLWET